MAEDTVLKEPEPVVFTVLALDVEAIKPLRVAMVLMEIQEEREVEGESLK